MKEKIIDIQNARKVFGSVKALDGISMSVEKGSIYGLIGDNGAGKSTLLRVLAGHIFLTEGEIKLWGNCEQREQLLLRKRMGCLIEEPAFYPEMTVEKLLRYYSIQKGIADLTKVEDVIQSIGLEKKKKSKCKYLSLGQKARLGLAIALLGEPQLLLLDEPINGLDPAGMIEIRNLLKQLNEEKGITILLSSHMLSELEQIATVYGFIKNGVLVEEITAEELGKKVVNHIEIKINDIEQYAALLSKYFPEESYQVLPDHSIRIYTTGDQAESFSRLAAEHGLYIIGMNIRKTSLEEYYLEVQNKEVVL